MCIPGGLAKVSYRYSYKKPNRQHLYIQYGYGFYYIYDDMRLLVSVCFIKKKNEKRGKKKP